jgi:hypothetical protein
VTLKYRILRRLCSITKKQIQELESQSRPRKEVKSDNRFSIICQERQPAFSGIVAMRPRPSKISRDRAFGDLEAELP